MKTIILPLKEFLRKAQYLEDEGFTITEDVETPPPAIYVKETDERLVLPLEDIYTMIREDKRITATDYHGKARLFAESVNILIDKRVSQIKSRNQDNGV